MASLIYLDTHVVAWLYAGRIDLLSGPARRLLEERELLVSPIVLLELEYLFESGRTGEPAAPVLRALEEEIGLGVCDLPFLRVVERALRQDWTRDPFDRLIVSQAEVRGVPLLTKDLQMRQHFEEAVW